MGARPSRLKRPTPDRLLWAIDMFEADIFAGIVLWRLSTPCKRRWLTGEKRDEREV